MAYAQKTIHTLYKGLLHLYPRAFREQLGEPMEQTFNDLYIEQKRGTQGRLFSFVLWMFVETIIAIIKEHILVLRQGDSMKNILANHNSAAITGFILSVPLGLLFVIFNFEIEPLTARVTALFTVNGYDVNGLGRIVLISGLFLLPVAFLINLLPMLKKEGPEKKRSFYAINLIVGMTILLLIISAWGGLIMEQIYCLRGIRCD